jgi:hypothetical protein
MKFKYLIIDEDGWVTGSNDDNAFQQAMSESGYDSALDLETGILYTVDDFGGVSTRAIETFKGR